MADKNIFEDVETNANKGWNHMSMNKVVNKLFEVQNI